MSTAGNIARIRSELARAALASGRRPEEVTLLAATKTQPVDRIREAIAAGVDACGENRVQEMLQKLDAYRGAPLHFIGVLQRNKVRQVVGKAALIHSVDSLALALEIDRCAKAQDIVQDILLEINIGLEASKSGFPPEPDALPLSELRAMSSARVRGLMCIPPFGLSEEDSVNSFLKMKQLYVDITREFCDNTIVGKFTPRFDILSMGMSGDYAAAVRCGSTLVRVGSAIFGPRA